MDLVGPFLLVLIPIGSAGTAVCLAGAEICYVRMLLYNGTWEKHGKGWGILIFAAALWGPGTAGLI